jgi:hypothetical protein
MQQQKCRPEAPVCLSNPAYFDLSEKEDGETPNRFLNALLKLKMSAKPVVNATSDTE